MPRLLHRWQIFCVRSFVGPAQPASAESGRGNAPIRRWTRVHRRVPCAPAAFWTA